MILPMENTEKMIFPGEGKFHIPIIKPETDIRIDKLEWIPVNYAQPDAKEKTAKTNKTNYLTYNVQAGAVDGKSFGINWDKVQSISGQTYSMRAEAKEHGLSWDGATKS